MKATTGHRAARKHRFSRRHALSALGVAGGALALGDLLIAPAVHAEQADPDKQPLFAFFFFPGGWDTLLSLDPRDHTQPEYSDPNNRIHTGYDLVADQDSAVAKVMDDTGNTGIITPNGSNIGFGVAMEPLAAHYEDLCIVRGISAGTLTHKVGERYVLTGKFPLALRASGSSLSTWWARENPGLYAIPNLVMRTETYNDGLDPRASGLSIDGYEDLATVLKPLNPDIEPRDSLSKALAELQQQPSCIHRQIDVSSLVSAHRAAFEQALGFTSGSLGEYFDFRHNPAPDTPIAKLYAAFGIDPANPVPALREPAGRAVIAAQAITQRVSRAVSISVTSGLDTHREAWASTQAARQREGWRAIANFISYMKATLDPKGKPYWDRMTILACSDFARTPRLNSDGGRDHFFYSAALIAGNGIKGNQVVGASSMTDYFGVPIDHATGKPDEMGAYILTSDVHATILAAAGLSYDQLLNQNPVLLQPALKS